VYQTAAVRKKQLRRRLVKSSVICLFANVFNFARWPMRTLAEIEAAVVGCRASRKQELLLFSGTSYMRKIRKCRAGVSLRWKQIRHGLRKRRSGYASLQRGQLRHPF